jgi:hypothetical protein
VGACVEVESTHGGDSAAFACGAFGTGVGIFVSREGDESARDGASGVLATGAVTGICVEVESTHGGGGFVSPAFAE